MFMKIIMLCIKSSSALLGKKHQPEPREAVSTDNEATGKTKQPTELVQTSLEPK